jgi:cellulose synthase/poly-beta-1,6-N-acetylglucosamine synthase-like glycosyltransferase
VWALAAGAALALWGAQSLVSTFAVAAFRRGLPQPEDPGEEPNVAIVLPVRGATNLAALIPRLRAQNYRRYRIVAAVEGEDDPAFAILSAAAREDGPPLEVTVAGIAEKAGQKVWKQLAALARLTPEDEVVAFIDADTLPTPHWLPRLVAVLVNSGRPVATGYRWMTPVDDRWSSAALAAANNALAALPRGALALTIVWGGSVAMRRATLEAIRLADYWRGAISDDEQMGLALRHAGLLAHAPRQGLVLSPVACSWRGFLEFGVRQYRIVYLHSRREWAVAMVVLWIPVVAFIMIAPSLVSGVGWVWAALAVLLALAEIRTALRRSLQKALWQGLEGPRDNGRWRVESLLRPVWRLLHALSAAGAPLSRTIDWAGIRYRVNGPQDIVVTRRNPVA